MDKYDIFHNIYEYLDFYIYIYNVYIFQHIYKY